MPEIPIDPRLHPSPRAPRGRSLRALGLALALSLGLACSRTGERPAAPEGELHYPAWLGTSKVLANRLFAVNLDQDLAFDNGSLVALDPTASPPAPLFEPAAVAVPNLAGKMLIVDPETAGADCAGETATQPYALIAARTEEALIQVPLTTPLVPAGTTSFDLGTDGASRPYGVGLSCSPGTDRTLRAWVAYQRGRDSDGYVARVDLNTDEHERVVVNLGKGSPRNFAYDRDRDRLYVTTGEWGGHAPIRWIAVGNGCITADNGVQDERDGGCHVDPGFDLSRTLPGAEPNDVALSTGTSPCTLGGYQGQQCRRMYLTVRMYDADRERLLNERPTGDVGGRLVVLELPESGLGGPDPQWVRGLDIGRTAGELLVIPRSNKRDLIVATALEDDLVWIYDDDTGVMVKVFGRDPNTGVPPLGSYPTGLAAMDLGGGTTRVFVSSYHDHWISAVDIPVDTPSAASIVLGSDGKPLHLGKMP